MINWVQLVFTVSPDMTALQSQCSPTYYTFPSIELIHVATCIRDEPRFTKIIEMHSLPAEHTIIIQQVIITVDLQK